MRWERWGRAGVTRGERLWEGIVVMQLEEMTIYKVRADSCNFLLRLGGRDVIEGVSCLGPPPPWGSGRRLFSVPKCALVPCLPFVCPSTSRTFCLSSSSPLFSFGFSPTLPAAPPVEPAWGPPLSVPLKKLRIRQELRVPCYGDKVPIKDIEYVVWSTGMLAFLCRTDKKSRASGVCQMLLSRPGDVAWGLEWRHLWRLALCLAEREIMLMAFCLLQ